MDLNQDLSNNEIAEYLAFITPEFNLPNHSFELDKAADIIKKLKEEVDIIVEQNIIDDVLHDKYFEDTARILDYVGRLSTYLFDILFPLEELYYKRFKHYPQLAKILWLEHYNNLHHPYSLLKNRCHTIMDNLDDAYKSKYNHNPPNWKL